MKLISILFVCSMSLATAQPDPSADCGKPIVCPDKPYPYRFCELNSNGTYKRTVTRCSNNPNGDANGKPLKRKMPVCGTFDASGGIPNGMTAAQIQSEIDKASYEWNCLCGKQEETKDPVCCSNIKFTKNVAELGGDDINTLGRQVSAERPYDIPGFQTCDELPCDIQKYQKTMYINLNKKWYLGDNATVGAYSLTETIQHELGHWMGLEHFDGHPTPGVNNDEAASCNGTGKGIMSSLAETSGGGAGKNRVQLSQDDKCMFMKLYCNNITSGVDIAQQINNLPGNIYPNPTKDIFKVEFEAELNSSVRVTLYNSLGEKVVTLMENDKQPPGKMGLEYNAEHLPSGEYNCVIEITNAGRTNKKTLKISLTK